jgi:hypothetical protein
LRSKNPTTALFDFKLPISIVSQEDNPTTAVASLNRTLRFDLLDKCSLRGLPGVPVDFYVNGTAYDGASYNPSNYRDGGTTIGNGKVLFDLPVPSGDGTYPVRAVFGGDAARCVCEVCVTVTVHAVPLAVLFSVSPPSLNPEPSCP